MNKTKKLSLYSYTAFKISVMTFLLIMLAGSLGAETIFEDKVTADGEILIFSGKVLDRAGTPLTDVSVEIWQTDERGVYDHPGDSNTRRRDKGFQFYGTSVSDKSGNYIFRTIVPGKYEPRPRHIHVKLRKAGRVLLTTQIYFSVDGDITGVGGSTRNLSMDLDPAETPDNSVSYTGKFDFVVDVGVTGDMLLTGRQSEGPYYPVEAVSEYDNDLANVERK